MWTYSQIRYHTESDDLDLSALPLGALMKAQRALAQARADSDSEADDDEEIDGADSDDESAPEEGPSRISEQGKPAEKERVRPDKRKHKHAYVSHTTSLRLTCEFYSQRPIEMSNKRRERKKIVIEDKKPVSCVETLNIQYIHVQYVARSLEILVSCTSRASSPPNVSGPSTASFQACTRTR